MTEKEKKEKFIILKTIVELIEDEEFPGRRNIVDFVLLLPPQEIRHEAKKFTNGLFNEYDRKRT